MVNKSNNSSQINLLVKLAKNSVVYVRVKLENGQVITKKMIKRQITGMLIELAQNKYL